MTIYIGDYYTSDDDSSSNNETYDSSSGDSSSDDCSSDDNDMDDDGSILSDPTMANITYIKDFLEAMAVADREIQQEFNQYIVEEVGSHLSMPTPCSLASCR